MCSVPVATGGGEGVERSRAAHTAHTTADPTTSPSVARQSCDACPNVLHPRLLPSCVDLPSFLFPPACPLALPIPLRCCIRQPHPLAHRSLPHCTSCILIWVLLLLGCACKHLGHPLIQPKERARLFFTAAPKTCSLHEPGYSR